VLELGVLSSVLPDALSFCFDLATEGAVVEGVPDLRGPSLVPAVTFMAVLGEGENDVYVGPHVEQMLGYTMSGRPVTALHAERLRALRRRAASATTSSVSRAITRSSNRGDTMVLFTDGIIESMNRDEELFDLGRMIKAIEEVADAGPEAIVDLVCQRVYELTNRQDDDMTVLAARFNG
jgi:hypothetical protein